MTLLLVIIVAFIVFMSISSAFSRVNIRINGLEDEIARMKARERANDRIDMAKSLEPVISQQSKTSEEQKILPVGGQAKVQPQAVSPVNVSQSEKISSQVKSSKSVEKTKSEFWVKVEKMFAENATGIIGVTAVVVGVVFLAIYAAISMGALARFVVVCGFSLLFYVFYILLAKRAFWQNIALWMRTASGVIFLVGCIGSSHLTYMKWVNDEALGLTLVGLGIFVNIVFGALSKKELFATVHILLSLFALLIIPFSFLLFVIAGIICFAGMVMALGNKKWNAHLAIVNIAFMIVNLVWVMNNFSVWPENSLYMIAVCLFVALPCLFSHYRRIYQGWDNVALVTHLIIWITLGVNLYLHSRGTIFSTIGLAVGAFATFVLSFYANKLKIEWLYVCDRLASLALGILTCISLYKFDIEYYQIAFYVSIFSVIFFKINTYVKNKITFEISNIIVVLGYFAFLAMLIVKKDMADMEKFVFLVISYVVNAILFPSLENYAKKENFGFEINDKNKIKTTLLPLVFALQIMLAAYFASIMPTNSYIWFAVAFAMSAYAIIFKEFYKNSITNALIIFVVLATSIYYMFLIYTKKYDMMLNLELFGIVLINGILTLICSWSSGLQRRSYSSGIFIVWSILMLAGYKLTIVYSTMLPAVIWLLVFVLGSDFKEIKWKKAVSEDSRNSPNYLVAKLSMITLLFFAVRFCLVDLSNQTLLLDVIPARFATELFSLVALLYWMISGTKVNNEYIKKKVNGLLEAFVIFSLFYLFAEISLANQGIVLASAALLFVLAASKSGMYDRIGLYSYILFFVALFNIGFVCASTATPSLEAINQTWFKSMIAIVISVIFAVVGGKKIISGQAIQYHTPNSISEWVKSLVSKYGINIIIYPLFLAVAFFFYRGFDKSVLSILWMVECFVLFMISLIMKKAEFRVFSMWCVAFIFARIMFFDLRGQDFLLKAIVFIIIGSILIVMNTIYNKYKYRYEK